MRLVSREKKSPAAWIGLRAGIAHENSCSGLGALLKIALVLSTAVESTRALCCSTLAARAARPRREAAASMLAIRRPP